MLPLKIFLKQYISKIKKRLLYKNVNGNILFFKSFFIKSDLNNNGCLFYINKSNIDYFYKDELSI